MNPCPPEIARIVAEIIRHGFLRIRAEGWAGRPDRCAAEADHLHNLPYMLNDYVPGMLEYYWYGERVAFIAETEGRNIGEFERLWDQLQPFVPAPTFTEGIDLPIASM